MRYSNKDDGKAPSLPPFFVSRSKPELQNSVSLVDETSKLTCLFYYN